MRANAGNTGSPIAPGRAATPAAKDDTAQQCPDDFGALGHDPSPQFCVCLSEAMLRGSVWGTDVYSADSSICQAALHAGVLGLLGGQITLSSAPGQRRYLGSSRNGVLSFDFGPYDASFRVLGRGPGTAASPVQAAVGPALRSAGRVQLYVRFRTASAELETGSAPVLAELLAAMRADPGLRLRLVGHTDSTGTPGGSRVLSMQRATTVQAWLVSQGIDADRLARDEHGQDEPLAPNTTADGRALNRRVEALRLP